MSNEILKLELNEYVNVYEYFTNEKTFKIRKCPLTTLISQRLETNLMLKYFTKFAFKSPNEISIKNQNYFEVLTVRSLNIWSLDNPIKSHQKSHLETLFITVNLVVQADEGAFQAAKRPRHIYQDTLIWLC